MCNVDHEDERVLRAFTTKAKASYSAKLKLLGLSNQDDPYAMSNQDKFVSDMNLWPPLEYGHIYCYFVQRPGVYTQQELMRWKSLEAYNYFQSGHVQEVKLWSLNSSSSILKALVNPSQRSLQNAHNSWVAVKEDGTIITAHCTCMAG